MDQLMDWLCYLIDYWTMYSDWGDGSIDGSIRLSWLIVVQNTQIVEIDQLTDWLCYLIDYWTVYSDCRDGSIHGLIMLFDWLLNNVFRL